MKKGKRGQIDIYIIFFVAAIFLVILVAFLAPIGIVLNTELYKAQEDIAALGEEQIDAIGDARVKTNVNDIIQLGKDNSVNIIDILAAMYRYAWVFIIIIVGIIVFLWTRKSVEFQVGFA